jgi:hypothetical protein
MIPKYDVQTNIAKYDVQTNTASRLYPIRVQLNYEMSVISSSCPQIFAGAEPTGRRCQRLQAYRACPHQASLVQFSLVWTSRPIVLCKFL